VQAAAYPDEAAARRRWIEDRRGPRNAVDPTLPHAFFIEEECSDTGEVVRVLTIFLTNRECPWRCLMCDLWKNTLPESVAPGVIPAQIDHAVSLLMERGRPRPQQFAPVSKALADENARTAHHIKLYNSGSFFDRTAIPKEDYPEIARRVKPFSRVILECHPKLVTEEVLRFRDLTGTELEVAMGLETANPETLARLNKGMTLEDFANAAAFLRKHDISVRAFILLKTPFTSEEEGVTWAKRSLDFAFDAGVNVACMIPTRAGNGALDALARRAEFAPPRLASLEETMDYGLGLERSRAFADLWDLQLFSDCARCLQQRHERLHQMNLSQRVLPRIKCSACES
jgi:radical SAM enzyme (TIGR01210 family)